MSVYIYSNIFVSLDAPEASSLVLTLTYLHAILWIKSVYFISS